MRKKKLCLTLTEKLPDDNLCRKATCSKNHTHTFTIDNDHFAPMRGFLLSSALEAALLMQAGRGREAVQNPILFILIVLKA